MNLNDFVVLPNNKAKSVKLNARNPQELQMATGTLAQESKEIEEQLQQLKESMSKEKEERALPRGFRWKSGQCASLNSNAVTSGVKKDKENRFQKLSSGKLTIRVLKDGLVTAPPPPPTLRDRRKNRLRGTYCGQCEIKTAGLTCAECAEDYCIGCFTKFHQKGALKLHRMIPIQTDLQTHVSTRDVVTCFQKQTNPTSCPTTCAGPVGAKPMQLHSDRSQVSIEDHEEEKKVEMSEEGPKMSFLEGEYNEVESASSFQEALRHWRGEKTDGSGESMREDAMWTPIRPVSVAVMATQADFSPGGGAAGRGRGVGEEKVPVRVEFTENSLTYMDRLLLKKLLRTPVENDHPLLAFGADLKLLPEANTGEETASGLTATCRCDEDIRAGLLSG
uniref:B box-type domain-containing protein n=1 Tax=Gasterosteus aculeatus aculeatus TaxID=481459 RepID=A0AAQ4RFP8_GASAC